MKRIINLVRNPLAWLVLALLLAVGLKTWLVAGGWVSFNSDEAVVALMARHILNGARPTFFYGQAYMGSLDAFLVALAFRIFGEQVWAIRLVQLSLYSGCWRAQPGLGKKIFDDWRVGALGALLLAIPAVNVTLYTTASLGGYGEALLLGNLILVCALQTGDQLESRGFPRSTLLVGAVRVVERAGFVGFWVDAGVQPAGGGLSGVLELAATGKKPVPRRPAGKRVFCIGSRGAARGGSLVAVRIEEWLPGFVGGADRRGDRWGGGLTVDFPGITPHSEFAAVRQHGRVWTAPSLGCDLVGAAALAICADVLDGRVCFHCSQSAPRKSIRRGEGFIGECHPGADGRFCVDSIWSGSLRAVFFAASNPTSFVCSRIDTGIADKNWLLGIGSGFIIVSL